MITKTYTILAAEGMHARPATALVRLVRPFQSSVFMRNGDKQVKLDSLLNILSLGTRGGDVISILIEGPDEETTAAVIETFFTEQLKHL